MRRHAANGDRHAALRQFERMDRALRRELGVAPGRDAIVLRDRLLGEHDVVPMNENDLIGRDVELAIAERALLEAAAGRGRTVIVHGVAGVGKSVLIQAISDRAREMSFRVGHGASSPVEGAWPYAPVVEALADMCRKHPTLLDGLADVHREEIDRALGGTEMPWSGGSSHQRLFVAIAELVRLASATHGLLLTIDDVHDVDDASLRLVHYLARSTASEHVCIVLGHRPAPLSATLVETRHSLVDRHAATVIEMQPLDEEGVALLIQRRLPGADSEQVAQITALSGGVPFAVHELARRAGGGARVGAGARREHGHRRRARDALRGAAASGDRRRELRHRRVRRARGRARRRCVLAPRSRARGARRRADEHRLSLPPRARSRRAARRPASASPPADPPRRRRQADRARRCRRRGSRIICSSRAKRVKRSRISFGPRRPTPLSARIAMRSLSSTLCALTRLARTGPPLSRFAATC